MNLLETHHTNLVSHTKLQKTIRISINYDKMPIKNVLTICVKLWPSTSSTGMECTLPSISHKVT